MSAPGNIDFAGVRLALGYHREWRAFAAREDHGLDHAASLHLGDIGRAVHGIECVAQILYVDSSERDAATGDAMLTSGHAAGLLEAIMALAAHVEERAEALAKLTLRRSA